MQSATIEPALLKVPNSQCYEEIREKMQSLLGLQKPPRIGEDIFQKSAYAHIGNHPFIPFRHQDPLVGVKGSQNPVLLFKKKEGCYLGLLDSNEEVVKSVALKDCRCSVLE